MAGIYGIGIQALNAAQMNLLTTQNNIANANTVGYHRQQAIQSSNLPTATGSGFIGQGAHIDTVRRLYNQFLSDQVQSTSTLSKYYDTYYSHIRQIDNIVADPIAGLSPAIQEFFTNVNAVANDPASISARQALISGGEALIARFESLYNRLNEIRMGINTQLDATVQEINSYSAQIASLNQRIIEAESAIGHQANDLRDQRDQAIANLNDLVKVSVIKQDNGAYNIFIGNGQTLVIGSTYSNLATRDDPNNPQQRIVSYVAGNGYIDIASSSLESGGSLGALLKFRRTSLDEAQNALGRVAIGLAQTFNDQHKLGLDLNGAFGGNFFNISSAVPTVYSNSNNTGTATVTASLASNVGALTTSNYSIEFDGTNYRLTDLGTNTVTTGLTSATLTTTLANLGVNLSISAGAAAGDKWQLLPTRFGADALSLGFSDPNLIAAGSPISTAANAANTGSASISSGTVDSSTQPPVNANLQQTVTITFTSATAFDVSGTGTGNPTGVSYTAGGNISYNGWVVQITGTPQAGDVFTIGANTSGSGDNRNALALAALQNTNLLANNSLGATATFQSAYTQMVSSIGAKTREMKLNSDAQTKQLLAAQEAKDSFSGVNLDEEAANLLKFQQNYQAAAKIIQIGSTLFDTILNIR